MDISKIDLFQALAAAREEFKPVKKSGFNPAYGSSYTTILDIEEATAEALKKYSLVLYDTSSVDERGHIITTVMRFLPTGAELKSESILPSLRDMTASQQDDTDADVGDDKKRKKRPSKVNYIQNTGQNRTYSMRYHRVGLLGLTGVEIDNDGNDLVKSEPRTNKGDRTSNAPAPSSKADDTQVDSIDDLF